MKYRVIDISFFLYDIPDSYTTQLLEELVLKTSLKVTRECGQDNLDISKHSITPMSRIMSRTTYWVEK